MKRVFSVAMSLICLFVVLTTATACDGSWSWPWEKSWRWPWEKKDEPKTEPITCTIQFAETVDEKYQPVKLYEEDRFQINTKIYVIVDFTMINYGEEEDYIEFKIQIPFAKYYSTYEYNKGVIEPKEEQKDIVNDDGTTESMIELSDMVFRVKAGQVPFHYVYCFTIEANSPCENVEFKAVFTSDNGIVISRNQTFSKQYSFVPQNGGDVE